MKLVYKFEVFYGEAKTMMPADAEIVKVGAIAGQMYCWAICGENRPNVPRQIGYFATGEQVPDDAIYVGTAITTDGAFVWHVFEGAALR